MEISDRDNPEIEAIACTMQIVKRELLIRYDTFIGVGGYNEG